MPKPWASVKRGHWHDVFRCPHTDGAWHERALQLVMQIEETASPRVAELMRLDLQELVEKHLTKSP